MSEQYYKNGFQDGYAESLKLGEFGRMERAKRKAGTRLMFQTIIQPVFEEIRQDYYDTFGTKVLKQKHLSRLTDISLAFWFGDDGSRCKNGGLAIHTNSFKLEAIEIACEWFKNKYNILCHPQKRAEKQWVIFFSNKTSFNFAEMIVHYLHPSLRYKLQGVYNYVKNPQRLNAIPFRLQYLLQGKSQSELHGDMQSSHKEQE